MAGGVVATAVDAVEADYSREKKRLLARMLAAQIANNPFEKKIH